MSFQLTQIPSDHANNPNITRYGAKYSENVGDTVVDFQLEEYPNGAPAEAVIRLDGKKIRRPKDIEQFIQLINYESVLSGAGVIDKTPTTDAAGKVSVKIKEVKDINTILTRIAAALGGVGELSRETADAIISREQLRTGKTAEEAGLITIRDSKIIRSRQQPARHYMDANIFYGGTPISHVKENGDVENPNLRTTSIEFNHRDDSATTVLTEALKRLPEKPSITNMRGKGTNPTVVTDAPLETVLHLLQVEGLLPSFLANPIQQKAAAVAAEEKQALPSTGVAAFGR